MRGLFLLLALTLPAPAQFWARLANPEVRIPLGHPPDLGLPLRPVAVVPMDGNARELADAVRAELAGGGAKLVDPAAVAWACAGENMASADAGTLARLHRRLGDAQLLLVFVSRAELQLTRSSHGGKENGKPVTFQEAEARLHFEGRLQAGDLVSQRLYPPVPFTAEPHASAESSQAPPPYPDPAALRIQALAGPRATAAHLLLPWSETLTETCFNDETYGLDKVQARLKAQDLEGAWELAHQAAQAARADIKGDAKYRSRAVYDLGLVAWLRGRPAEAQPLFQEALDLLPDASIPKDALRDAKRAQDAAEALARWRSQPPPEVSQARAGLPPAAGAGEGASPEARLKALKRLRDQGLITDADYAAKKADILKGL